MNAITVNELKCLCDEQIKAGNGNKQIMISSDDEGNSFHHLFQGYTEMKLIAYDENGKPDKWFMSSAKPEEYDKFIILG